MLEPSPLPILSYNHMLPENIEASSILVLTPCNLVVGYKIGSDLKLLIQVIVQDEHKAFL